MMQPAQVLSLWATVCRNADLRWYLYKDALLCAEGYGRFPDTLKCAQVAVFAKDLPVLTEQVFPSLPDDWSVAPRSFSLEQAPVVLLQEDAPILEIHVLCSTADTSHSKSLRAQANRIRAAARTKIKLLGLFGGLFRNTRDRIANKAFRALVSLAVTLQENAPMFCDHLTDPETALFPAAWLERAEQLACDGAAYPVFAGYKDYLAEVYGDYKTGLFDEIGCGLTAEGKAGLKLHQAHCKAALAFVNQLSQEFGLRYYLLAGSVLGPVRHGGFIPWDDDIDIGIRIEELAHFEDLVAKNISRLGEGFHLMISAADDPYPRMFSKICYEGRCCIDLWPLVPTYTKGLRAEWTWYFAKIITKVHYKKIGVEPTRFVKLVNLMSRFLSDKAVMALARRNERRYAGKNTPAYINLYSIYRRKKETILRRWLDTPATANFDGLTVPVVGCTEEYLNHLYGDYMALPAPWKRASRHVERFGVAEK